MGKVITKQIRGMNWVAKASLLLLVTLLTSVFMYQGLIKPNSTQADVTVNQAWSSVYTGVAFPGSYAYPISAGPNRKLIVAITSTTSAAATQTVSVTYGTKSLTQGAGDTSSTNTLQHSYLFYLDEADIAAASTNSLAVSISGGTAVYNTVYAAVYSGAAGSVSTPVNYSNALSSAPTFNPIMLSIAAGDLAVETINLASVTGTAPTISSYASGWSQALGNNTAFGNSTTPGVQSYAASNTPAVGNSTDTYSAHTASGNASISMSAFIINKAPGSAIISSIATTTPVDTTSIYKADTVSYPTTVTLNGTGLTGTTAVVFTPVDANITISNLNVISDTQLTVDMTASASATVGNRTLSITNAAGTSFFLAAGFVKSNLPAPTITAFTPTTIGLGNSSAPVTITGTGFQTGATIAFSPSNGVTYSNFTVNSDTSLSLLLTLSSSAATGPYNVTVTNPDAKTTGTTGNNAFTAKPAPTALTASPYGLAQGFAGNVTLTGTGFASGITAALGNGSCSVGTAVYNNINSVTVPVTVPADGALNSYCTFKLINSDGGSATSSSLVQILSPTPTTPVITSVSPNTVAQNIQAGGPGAQYADVDIYGSNFDVTSTVSFSSSRVTLVSTTVLDSTHLVARITTSTSSAQSSSITVTGAAGSFTGTGAFYITNAPTVSATTPINITAGVLGNSYDLTFTGTNFESGATVAFPAGSGVTVSSVNAVNSTTLTAHIDIDAGATLGLQTITITNPDFGVVTTTFSVQTLTPPAVTLITPASIGQGATNVSVVINGLNFAATPTVLFGTSNSTPNANFTTNSVVWNSSSQLTANVSIAAGATAAATNVTVINPNNEAVVATGLFTVTARPGTMTLLPASAPLGSTNLALTITTSGLVIGSGFDIKGADGVTVTSPAITSPTTATAVVSIDPLYSVAPLGNHTITLTNGDYGTRTANFNVTGLAPTVTAITPSSAKLGATAAPVVITGTNFYPGATVALGNSTGITIVSQTRIDDTTINATLALTVSATAGPADIKVTNSDAQSATGSGLFSTAPAPTLTSNSPLTGGQGANVDVTITGSGFAAGATALFSGTGITVTGTDVVSDTQVTAHIAIAADAFQTERSITVTNSDGSNASGGSFTITQPEATAVGSLSFYQVTTNSITVAASYTNDGNNNNSCVIKWGTELGSYPNTATVVKGVNAFTATVTGLPAGTEGSGKQFFFQATFTDADGISGTNPAVGSQSTSGSLLLHNNLNTSSEKWSQGWGTAEGKYGVITCVTCHSKNTTNNKLVAGTFNASTGTWDSSGSNSLTVIYDNTTPLGTDDIHASSTKACEACHTKTNHHKYNNVAANHEGSVDCITCHSHNEAFMPTCSECHSTQQGTRRQVVGNGGDFFANMSSHARFTNSGSQTCAVCHYGSTHKTLSDGVSVNLKNADTGAPVLFDGTTATAAALKNVCISCHDANGASILGTNALSPFAVTGDKNIPANIDKFWVATGGAHDTKMVCMNCHGNSKGVDGDTTNPKYNAHASGTRSILQDAGYNVTNPNNYCIGCHNNVSADPNRSAKDIASQMANTNKHITAKCFDCHGDENNAVSSVHQLVAGSQSAMSGVIANNISKATGRVMTWAAYSWGGASASSSLQSGTVTAEYQVCFKCHAKVGTGTTPDVPGTGTAAASLTNLALEFNPNNASRHPIGTALRSSDQLASGELTGSWAPGSVMTCSDCHATDTAASKGPHGSSVKWMLTGQYKAWPYTTAAGNGGSSGTLYTLSTAAGNNTNSNGLFCRNCHTIVGSNNWHSWSELATSGGEHTSNGTVPACATCHIRVPHGGKISRLLQTTGAPARYTNSGNGATPSFDAWGTATQSIKGSSASSTYFNSQCSEHNNGAVGGEHW